jgi:hypothetical protein
MTVLSVMVVTYLLTMRHQRLSAQHHANRIAARQYLHTALTRAMEYADHAMLASNYVSQATTPLTPSQQRQRRLYPLGVWYSRDYQPDTESRITDEVDYQNQEILTVPVLEDSAAAAFATNRLTVDLLTEEVRRMLPPAITNSLAASQNSLRSGWITDADAGFRISFAVVNCSGLADAHTFDFEARALKPPTQSYDRVYFNEQDLLNDRGGDATSEQDRELLDHLATLSYDPAPYAIPSEARGSSPHSRLGYRDFAITNKFNLNSLTNYYDEESQPGYERLHVTLPFLEHWMSVVSNAVHDAQRDQQQGVVLGDSGKVAWNIAAYMSPSRVPQISFPGVALASRTDFGIEAVPLVNEVAVFNCVDESLSYDPMFEEAIEKIRSDLQRQFANKEVELAPIVVSNVYAAAAELWYPFAPRPVFDPDRPDSVRVYLGVYTNRSAVTTTTNTQWDADDLAEWYDSVAELKAHELNREYRESPSALTNSLFWLIVRTNDLVVSNIIDPRELNETEHLDFSTALAIAYVGEFTDPATGQIMTNNPYLNLLNHYAPPPPGLSDAERTLYYSNASNYVPVLVTVMTSRLDDVAIFDEGFSRGSSGVEQEYLPSTKVQIGPFGSAWTPEDSGGHALRDEDFNAQGFFAVTNIRDLAYFPVLVPPDRLAGETLYRIKFMQLGGARKMWVRPLVAVQEPGSYGLEENDYHEAVDEALLVRESDADISVVTWPPKEDAAVKSSGQSERFWSLSVADPRDNAWWRSDATGDVKWRAARPTFGAANARTGDELEGEIADEGAGYSDDIPGVAELPFIHADAPLRSIGELGYVTADLDRAVKAQNKERHARDRNGKPVVRDTIDFSTVAGAALLDRFTAASTNGPTRGLVHADTPYPAIIAKLIENAPLGWTNSSAQAAYDPAAHLFALSSGQGLEDVTASWTNALLKAFDPAWDHSRSGLPGWRSFAEMLPDIYTNAERLAGAKLASLDADPFYRHDLVEDALRSLAEKVSFRQNIYVVVVAAQALSPASTESSPFVLSDQRAAVTVLRDAFTGRWMIYNWVWLTE